MLDTALAVCAAAWGVVMALSPLLQIRQMISQQSSRDVSIGYFCVCCSAASHCGRPTERPLPTWP